MEILTESKRSGDAEVNARTEQSINENSVREMGGRAMRTTPQHAWELEEPADVELSNGLEWQVDALCAQTDPEAFFPEKGGSTRNAKKICTDCDVREECLSYAIDHEERFGVWGGLSERERRKLKSRSTDVA